jgi:integrase
MATITDPKEIAGLLLSIDDYRGSIIIRCALQLAPLAFVRQGELRHAEWSEINFDAAEWRIPAEKMKAGVLHILIGALLQIIMDKKLYETEEELREEFVVQYKGFPGCTFRTTAGRFADAKRLLSQ